MSQSTGGFHRTIPHSPFRILTLAVVLFPVAVSLVGCGYMIGSAYQAEIRSVHVPTFTSDGFRRGFEYELTEAVHKEIQQRTPFRLAKGPVADTLLKGHIVQVRKDVLGETAFDDPRELQLSFAVQVTWEDLRTGRILREQQIPISPDVVHFASRSEIAPEVGHSLATGKQQAIDNLAQRIIDMMETPW